MGVVRNEKNDGWQVPDSCSKATTNRKEKQDEYEDRNAGND